MEANKITSYLNGGIVQVGQALTGERGQEVVYDNSRFNAENEKTWSLSMNATVDNIDTLSLKKLWDAPQHHEASIEFFVTNNYCYEELKKLGKLELFNKKIKGIQFARPFIVKMCRAKLTGKISRVMQEGEDEEGLTNFSGVFTSFGLPPFP